MKTRRNELIPIVPQNPSDDTRHALDALTAMVYYARTHPGDADLDFLRDVGLYTIYRSDGPPVLTVNYRGLEITTYRLRFASAIGRVLPKLPTTVVWPNNGLHKLDQLRVAALHIVECQEPIEGALSV